MAKTSALLNGEIINLSTATNYELHKLQASLIRHRSNDRRIGSQGSEQDARIALYHHLCQKRHATGNPL